LITIFTPKIEPVRIRVQLHRNFVAGSGLQHRIPIECVSIAAKQKPAGRVPDDRGVGILNCLQQARGHFLRHLVEVRVHAGNHQVHLIEHRIREIERTAA
jgi:hypothetical protein